MPLKFLPFGSSLPYRIAIINQPPSLPSSFIKDFGIGLFHPSMHPRSCHPSKSTLCPWFLRAPISSDPSLSASLAPHSHNPWTSHYVKSLFSSLTQPPTLAAPSFKSLLFPDFPSTTAPSLRTPKTPITKPIPLPWICCAAYCSTASRLHCWYIYLHCFNIFL